MYILTQAHTVSLSEADYQFTIENIFVLKWVAFVKEARPNIAKKK